MRKLIAVALTTSVFSTTVAFAKEADEGKPGNGGGTHAGQAMSAYLKSLPQPPPYNQFMAKHGLDPEKYPNVAAGLVRSAASGSDNPKSSRCMKSQIG